MKSGRNKTIQISVAEGQRYLERCLEVAAPVGVETVLGKTIHGDALTVLPLLPRGFVDLLIVDPPYNLDKDFHGAHFREMPEEAYEAYTERWLLALLPLLKPDASVYVCCDWRSTPVVTRVLQKHLIVRSRITWQREKGRGARANWKNTLEDILFATLSDVYTFHLDAVKLRRRVMAPYRKDGEARDWQATADGNFRDTCPGNFWDDITVPYWSMAENTPHPAQKPEKLLAKLILASSDPGDVVLDPFLGSGTTSVTAKKLGRNFVGIEQNDQYCAWAEKRLETADSAPAIQGYEDGVFWERNSRPRKKSGKS